ncbi:hypothetical protein LX87_00561 [Larkinella arboricola]|uniref:Outer membrane protein with beta-barrel domain n=1 Tax=Larkinella arboricola TaxID=643671 RepID=A0A327X6S7_LARAB|nr:hypothetical protein [Larkinella arboricola]RAK02441.1 hypothetical protein LX87_00561 [Larkinella arboricola]
MKRILFTLIACCGFYFLYAQSAQAQQTTYSQEDSTVTTSELKRAYQYITRANVEEKTLIKVGFWPNAGDRDYTGRPSFRIGLNADVSVERKITPSFSLLAGADFMLRYNRFNQFAVPFYNGNDFNDTDKIFRAFVYAKVGARYYYGMAKRIQEGKSANNFSGNYVGLQLTKGLSARVIQHIYDTKTGASVRTENGDYGSAYNAPLLSAMWGMQRRLGRRGFVDINAGPEVTIPVREWKRRDIYTYLPFIKMYKNSNRLSLSLRVNAVIGLGW